MTGGDPPSLTKRIDSSLYMGAAMLHDYANVATLMSSRFALGSKEPNPIKTVRRQAKKWTSREVKLLTKVCGVLIMILVECAKCSWTEVERHGCKCRLLKSMGSKIGKPLLSMCKLGPSHSAAKSGSPPLDLGFERGDGPKTRT